MKKVVRFKQSIIPVVGHSVLVEPIDHPDCTNEGVWAITSHVVAVFPNGDFETQNTLYVKEGA